MSGDSPLTKIGPCPTNNPYDSTKRTQKGLELKDLVPGQQYSAECCRPFYENGKVEHEHVRFTFIFDKALRDKPTVGQPTIVRMSWKDEIVAGMEAHTLGLMVFDGGHEENEFSEWDKSQAKHVGKWNHFSRVTKG